MLYVIFDSIDGEVELQWHIGEKLWPPRTPIRQMANVEVQANSDELNSILQKFPFLYPGREQTPTVISWFGDDTKFIIKNMLNLGE